MMWVMPSADDSRSRSTVTPNRAMRCAGRLAMGRLEDLCGVRAVVVCDDLGCG